MVDIASTICDLRNFRILRYQDSSLPGLFSIPLLFCFILILNIDLESILCQLYCTIIHEYIYLFFGISNYKL